ncbi:MAG: NAD(P)/FAD-dependent oxidoreductase [Gammaproteobacteria bacterium]|nr:NAD(P)/FAD-dependent oxidoreductase [Gammaproteobacteria bacterium]
MNKPVPQELVTSGKLTIPSPDVLGFDPTALRRKYDAERDRRLRPEGAAQYQDIDGELHHYNDDPHITERIERAPTTATIEVAILGGGFGGMLMAARLERAGIRDFRIIERAGDFGGTWYWNRYPGAQCDVESYIYLPLLDETGYMPSLKYSFQPEIFAHAQRVGHHFDLYSRSFFETQVRELRWDDLDARWIVTTDRGDVLRARHVVISSGSLNRPKLPGLPGLRNFKGHTFHTSRWDYDYTGGSPAGDLDKLRDKRVAIIGTGATGIQAIPHLGAAAGHLYVFQRTPSSVDERRNRPTDPAWYKSLQPGWQLERNDNFTKLLVGVRVEEDLVNDGWTELFKSLGELQDGTGASNLSDADMKQLGEIVDFRHDNRVRARCDETVNDPKTAEALKHWYRPWCKRPCFNDEYLPTFNRPNVTLVDTGGKGVDRLTEKGVVVDGVEYEIDCLIFATGFEVSRATYTHQAELEIIGRNGVTLGEYWANGMRTYHGLMSHGFPNLHHMGFTQTGYTPNFTYQLDKQAQHLAALFTDTKARGLRVLEPTKQAEEDYLKLVMAPNGMTEYLANCTPGYYNAEGNAKANHEGFLQGHYPEGGLRFYEMLAEWRAKGDYAGLIVR